MQVGSTLMHIYQGWDWAHWWPYNLWMKDSSWRYLEQRKDYKCYRKHTLNTNLAIILLSCLFLQNWGTVGGIHLCFELSLLRTKLAEAAIWYFSHHPWQSGLSRSSTLTHTWQRWLVPNGTEPQELLRPWAITLFFSWNHTCAANSGVYCVPCGLKYKN